MTYTRIGVTQTLRPRLVARRAAPSLVGFERVSPLRCPNRNPVFNIEQSVHYYHVRNTDSPTPCTCVCAATNFLFL